MKPTVILILLFLVKFHCFSQQTKLAKEIRSNKTFEHVYTKGLDILKTGFNAGSGYQEVWILDLNTFIVYSLKARPQQDVRDALTTFFRFQGFDGNIPNGYQQVGEDYVPDNYGVNVRYDMPGYVFHKNTVETDQEISLIHAIYKYITETGDTTFLNKEINGRTILDRCEYAMEYLLNTRFNKKNQLILGTTTVDWGDVQPAAHNWGVKLDDYSTPAFDIYDNTIFLIAIDNFLKLTSDENLKKNWTEISESVWKNVIGALMPTFFSSHKFLIYSAIVSVFSLLTLVFSTNVIGAWIIIFIIGIGIVNIFPLIFSIAVKKIPKRPNEIPGLMMMAISGGAVIPLLIGGLSDAISITTGMLVLIACILYILIASLAIDLKTEKDNLKIGVLIRFKLKFN